MTPLDVAALKAVAKDARILAGQEPIIDRLPALAKRLWEWADTIEASLPTHPVIEVTPEVKGAIERMSAAVLRGLLK